ncbi:MAG: histidine--tRNA ligase, partial [Muribaculaceae bacterium]|nr:histidine--tRNA ligase [Muribaculaceae bacterium]
AEIYPDQAKMKKQIGFADATLVPFFAIIGDKELSDGTVTVKNMASGEQMTVAADALADIVR